MIIRRHCYILAVAAAALLAAYEEYCRELNAYAAALFAEKFEGIL